MRKRGIHFCFQHKICPSVYLFLKVNVRLSFCAPLSVSLAVSDRLPGSLCPAACQPLFLCLAVSDLHLASSVRLPGSLCPSAWKSVSVCLAVFVLLVRLSLSILSMVFLNRRRNLVVCCVWRHSLPIAPSIARPVGRSVDRSGGRSLGRAPDCLRTSELVGVSI